MKQADSINARQIKAARALLDWSQRDLAKVTDISVATIRRLETGYISPRSATTNIIWQCFESAGIEFLESDGVRRRPSGIFIFEGGRGGKDFFEDMKQTVQKYGGDVLIVTPTAEAFAKYCGLPNILGLDCLVDLNKTVIVKCLITNEVEVPFSTPRFQFRIISRSFMDPVPFCGYGEKYGIATPNGEPFCKLVVIESPKMALAARQHFVSLWDKATHTITTIENKTKIA
ncbi:MAG: helix-turn-helix domain-containing protein [Alphaproteobacteria bacterium]|nr:helix-turn-helix domain-containing protein [Alphaproteobacteria bacterium]